MQGIEGFCNFSILLLAQIPLGKDKQNRLGGVHGGPHMSGWAQGLSWEPVWSWERSEPGARAGRGIPQPTASPLPADLLQSVVFIF